MLDVVGHASLDAMTDAIVPAKIKSPAPLALPESMTEVQALAKIRAIADKNTELRSFIGQGYYGTHTPNVILRNIPKTRRGTPPTPRTRRKSRRAAWKR